MNAMLRRRFLTGLLAATGFSAGCGDLGSLVYFLMPEQKIPAEIKSLATSDKKKEVKALILVRNPPQLSYQFINADRELAAALYKQLKELCEYNDEHLTLVDPRKVDAFKDSNPYWYQLPPGEVGNHFKVDYVIYLEVNQLSMSSAEIEMVCRGRADLSVRLIDVKNPEESTTPKHFSCTYPSEANFILADENTPPQVFREKFLAYAAKRLAWYFAPHPARDSHMVE